MFGDILRADGDLAALVPVVVARGKGRVPHFLAERTERGDKRIFKRRFIHSEAVDVDPFRTHDFFHLPPRGIGRMRQQIQAISKSLHVKDVAVGASNLAHGTQGFAEVRRAQFDALGMQTGAKFIRRADLLDFVRGESGRCDGTAPLHLNREWRAAR